MKIEIDVGNWDEEQFAKYVTERILERVETRVREAVDGRIDGAINAEVMRQIVSVTAEKIEPLVSEIVERGWPVTNNYGEAIGGTKTLAAMVRDVAALPRRDGYNSKPALIEEQIKAMATELVTKELRPAAEEWRKAMRTQLDASLTEAVAKAMRQAMGIL